MLRTSFLILLLLAVPAPGVRQRAMAQAGDGVRDPSLPTFLQPPPRELLQKGLQPLSAASRDTRVREGLMPPDASQGLFDSRWPTYDRGDQWTPVDFHWIASGSCYRSLYFEDAMLERHGQSRHALFQPLASGTRFFASIAAAPYAMVVDPPCRPASSLGHFRPGSSVPCLLQRPPLQADAGLFQAGLVVGLIFLVP